MNEIHIFDNILSSFAPLVSATSPALPCPVDQIPVLQSELPVRVVSVGGE